MEEKESTTGLRSERSYRANALAPDGVHLGQIESDCGVGYSTLQLWLRIERQGLSLENRRSGRPSQAQNQPPPLTYLLATTFLTNTGKGFDSEVSFIKSDSDPAYLGFLSFETATRKNYCSLIRSIHDFIRGVSNDGRFIFFNALVRFKAGIGFLIRVLESEGTCAMLANIPPEAWLAASLEGAGKGTNALWWLGRHSEGRQFLLKLLDGEKGSVMLASISPAAWPIVQEGPDKGKTYYQVLLAKHVKDRKPSKRKALTNSLLLCKKSRKDDEGSNPDAEEGSGATP